MRLLHQPYCQDWHPSIWNDHPSHQIPDYHDIAALQSIVNRIAASPPLVSHSAVIALKQSLSPLHHQDGFWLQMGDCAESMILPTPDYAINSAEFLHYMGQKIADTLKCPVITVARMAGQFAKPRSQPFETHNQQSLPVYRGDLVNGFAFDVNERRHNPERLWSGYEYAKQTLNSLAPWLSQGMVVSHDALHLYYEQALCRQDLASCAWYLSSAHTVWLGNQTRNITGAHVAFLRGVINPIGIKCGPDLNPSDLNTLLEILNPTNDQGKIILICRPGKDAIQHMLPAWINAIKAHSWNVLWVCDPMHGNTKKRGHTKKVNGGKIRIMNEMITEVQQFSKILQQHGLRPQGLHLETTPLNVEECLDDASDTAIHPLSSTSLCDPRLNPQQCWQVIQAMLDCLASHSPS